jgi:ferric-dicitrate binding protein FerR (iron transport regulator)
MQRDLNRMLKRKRRRHRVVTLLVLMACAALIVVAMRSCSDRFSDPYNKDYRPMDTQRHTTEQSF